ncbi:MAG TPA: hypothetical protein VKU36_02000 [Candidatus Babeliales bacterium]|jgi:hypothetical protein|nr:hypothetical protein [Candidatus Babeliales bacterium]
MNKKYLFLPLFFSVLCGTSFLNIVAVGLGETIAAGGAAYKMGKYAYDYVFNTEENKEIIKKHLPADSYIAQTCDKYLSQSCIALATHFRNLEEYHKIGTLEKELEKTDNPLIQEIIKECLDEAHTNKIKMNLPDDTGTYWESLPDKEKKETLQLTKTIIKDNIHGIDNIAQEATYIIESLNK